MHGGTRRGPSKSDSQHRQECKNKASAMATLVRGLPRCIRISAIAYGTCGDIHSNCGNVQDTRGLAATTSASTSAAVPVPESRGHQWLTQGLRQVSSVDGSAFKTRKYARGRSDFTLQEGNTGDVPPVPAYPSPSATIAQVSAAHIRRQGRPLVFSKCVSNSCNNVRSECDSAQDSSTAAQESHEHARHSDCTTPAQTPANPQADHATKHTALAAEPRSCVLPPLSRSTTMTSKSLQE